jgi:hypothetical protein
VCSHAPTGKATTLRLQFMTHQASARVTTLTQRLRGYCRVPKQGVPTINDQEKQTPEKTTPKALPTKTERAKTTNETPRPRSDSHEIRSMGCLDRVLTCTRLARRNASTIEKSLTRTTLGQAGRPTSFTNSETKVKAINANPQPLPTPMATSVTSMEAVPVSNLTFYCPSRDGR